MELKNFYNKIGENYDLLLSRLLSSERIEKYLTIFFDDNNICDLKMQILSNDIQSAINTAHTLKGVTATLGFDNLAAEICELHEALKNNENEQADELCRQVVKEYEIIYNEWCNIKNTLTENDIGSGKTGELI
ncbi:Hpt domain-containing protein [Ruminococcus sp.]|uniref:Hpt domain-containing protein n=1 Tax=Ruminococcus sp. TaxID=41978 RepID=UPI0025ED1734|nr:Hpt domain-containing protein [Ruminococcus sp.]